MSLTHDEKMRLYDVVSDAVARQPLESIEDAAKRIERGTPDWRVARIILSPAPVAPWTRMMMAANVARRVADLKEPGDG